MDNKRRKKPITRLLPGLFLLFLLCGPAGATDLFITVQDSVDQTPVSYAAVYMDGSNMGQTTTSGTFLLSHTYDTDFELKIIKNGYPEWRSIVAANMTELLVRIEGQTRLLTVQLFDADSLGPVTGAIVSVSLDTSGDTRITDDTGIATFSVTPGAVYSVSVSAPEYQAPAIRTVEILSSGKTVQYWLVRNDRFSLAVTDREHNPVAGAGIFLNEEPVGSTDARGALILKVARDTPYSITVTKEGYEEFHESRTFGESEAVYRIVMVKLSGEQVVTVYDVGGSPVEGAEVYLDDSFAGYSDTNGNVVLQNIGPGTYTLEVLKEGHAPVRQTSDVTGKGDSITVELPLDSAELTIFTRDKDQNAVPDARIVVNDVDLGLSDASGRTATTVPYNTPVTIRAQKEGYQTASVTTSVLTGNTTSSVTLVLERSPDWGIIAAVILGACILVVGVRIWQKSRKPRRHIVRRNEI